MIYLYKSLIYLCKQNITSDLFFEISQPFWLNVQIHFWQKHPE